MGEAVRPAVLLAIHWSVSASRVARCCVPNRPTPILYEADPLDHSTERDGNDITHSALSRPPSCPELH